MSDERILQHSTDPQPEVPDWLEAARPEQAGPVKQRFSTFGVTAMLLALGLLVVIAYALYQRSQKQPTEGPAPKFSITTFDADRLGSYSDKPMKLGDLKGNVVVINFWASYCVPCKEEAPMLERVWRDLQDDNVVFLGINTDDIEGNALAYLDEYDITYPNAPDQGGLIEDSYRITGIPETFIINPDGNVTKHFISAISERDLRSAIDKARNG